MGGAALAGQTRQIVCPNMHVPNWQPKVNAGMAEVYAALGITMFNLDFSGEIYTVPAVFVGSAHAALTSRTTMRQAEPAPMTVLPIAPAVRFQTYYRKEPSPEMCALASLVGARFVRVLDRDGVMYWVHADQCEVVIRQLDLLTP